MSHLISKSNMISDIRQLHAVKIISCHVLDACVCIECVAGIFNPLVELYRQKISLTEIHTSYTYAVRNKRQQQFLFLRYQNHLCSAVQANTIYIYAVKVYSFWYKLGRLLQASIGIYSMFLYCTVFRFEPNKPNERDTHKYR